MSTAVRKIRKYTVYLAVLWTVSIAAIALFNYSMIHRQIEENILDTARAFFVKDVAFRKWAASHGGVYVPPTDLTPPNPYLSDQPDRDLETTGGRKLTLINPAYMLRQVAESFSEPYGIREHITSLRPLNPGNAPDEWERRALVRIEKGEAEVSERVLMEGTPYLRMIRPLLTEAACLKCHGKQGYKEGDIRGGITISLPLEETLRREREVALKLFATHFLILVLGLCGIGVAGLKSLLNARKLEIFLSAGPDMHFRVDAEGVILDYHATQAADLYLPPEGFIGRKVREVLPREAGELTQQTIEKAIMSQEPTLYEYHLEMPGGVRHYEGRVFPFTGNECISIVRDITERKSDEARLVAMVREKDVLLSEVHHRVKNNMAVVSSLLTLQASHVQDEGCLEALEECQGRIYSMAMVHERLYRSHDFARIDLSEYLTALAYHIRDSFAARGQSEVRLHLEPLSIEIDVLIPLGLVVNELLSNSYKHGLDRTRPLNIDISLSRVEPGRMRLVVTDDGKGLPEGFDLNAAKGLGLKLVQSLVRQVEGSIRAERKPTRFTLEFTEKIRFARPV